MTAKPKLANIAGNIRRAKKALIIFKKSLLLKFLVPFAGMAAAVWFAPTALASSWQSVAFTGSNVSLVSVNPDQQTEILAVVDGRAEITLDGGILWRSTPIPALPTGVVFDSVRPGDIYVGTQRGIFRSTDLGMSWQAFGNDQSQVLNVTAITANSDDIFTTENAGVGTATQFDKISRSGTISAVSFPVPNPYELISNDENGDIFAATNSTIYRSSDDGTTWIALAGPVGQGTSGLEMHAGQLWQTSADGVFRSTDSGSMWAKLAGYPPISEFYPGYSSSTHGLAINHGNAFFGISSPFYHLQQVYEVNGSSSQSLGFPDVPNDIAEGAGQLWVAGTSGLWRRDDLVSSEANIKRPVIIVPGVLGSWRVLGKWELDPIMHTYDPLLAALRQDGYQDDVTLFSFPYQWRQDNNISAQQLSDKIAEVKKICACDKVDIIGHSMGGLVARAYIESNYYHSDINTLVELGTPNAGSVDDYSVWEAGVSESTDKYTRLEFKLFNLEAYENEFSNLTDYVRTDVTSVGQLLPIFNYINSRAYPLNYPANNFLEVLNDQSNLALLESRVHLYIVGSDSKSTLNSLTVGSTGPGDNWPNGQITSKSYGKGDGTVPIQSLTSIAAANLLEDEDHGGLASVPNEAWIQPLVGDELPANADSMSQINRLMLVYVKSPVRISITDPVGHQINDSTDQVNGAFFTGSDDPIQFATIPNPGGGNYQINLLGKGQGKYTLGVAIIDQNPTGDSQIEETGSAVVGQDDHYLYDAISGELTLTSSDIPVGQVVDGTLTADQTTESQGNPFLPQSSVGTEYVKDSIVSSVAKIGSAPAKLNVKRADIETTKLMHDSTSRLSIFALMLSGIIAVTLWLLRKLNLAS